MCGLPLPYRWYVWKSKETSIVPYSYSWSCYSQCEEQSFLSLFCSHNWKFENTNHNLWGHHLRRSQLPFRWWIFGTTSSSINHLSDQSTTIHSTQQYSQASPTQSSTNSFHTAIDSYQSYSIGQQFALEFGGMTTLNNLSVIEEACVTLLSPFPWTWELTNRLL